MNAPRTGESVDGLTRPGRIAAAAPANIAERDERRVAEPLPRTQLSDRSIPVATPESRRMDGDPN